MFRRWSCLSSFIKSETMCSWLAVVGIFFACASAAAGKVSVADVARSDTVLPVPAGQNYAVRVVPTVLAGNSFSVDVTLGAIVCENTCMSWAEQLPFRVSIGHGGGKEGVVVFQGVFANVTSPSAGAGNGLSFTVSNLKVPTLGAHSVTVDIDGATRDGPVVADTFSIPPVLSIIPPAVTLVLAMGTKQVVPSLLLGIWCGALFTNQYNPIVSFCNTFSVYFSNAVSQGGHAPVVLFTLVLGGVLELVDKSGGATGLARVAREFASTRFRALLCAWGLSMFIFFDDYSCILIVGATLKSSLREVRVSPAKLAFIIHIVGVNLPSLCPISSWTGVELGYIKGQYADLGFSNGAFTVFLRTLPYRFFPLLAMMMPLLSILTRRDFGPLLSAEEEFLNTAQDEEANTLLDPLVPAPAPDDALEDSGKEPWCGNAVIPFSVIIVATFAGIFLSGMAAAGPHATIIDIVAHSESVNALLWSAAASSLVCLILFASQRLMSLETMVSTWTKGFKDMMEPILILLLAWALGGVIVDLQTSNYLSGALAGNLPSEWLAPLGTALAAIVSFASGSAMGTMGILFPLILPLANDLSGGDEQIIMQAAAAVLAGSTFGNTCSPIADNTVLASLSTGCDLVLHAKTMAPYTLLTGGVSFFFGTLPVSLGWYGPAVGLLICLAVVTGILLLVGKDADRPDRSKILQTTDTQ